MLALVALPAGTVVAYGWIVLMLHSLRVLPGLVGRVAGRLMLLVTPAVVQRLLDLLVGVRCSPKGTLAAVWARYARRLSAASAAKSVNPPASP